MRLRVFKVNDGDCHLLSSGDGKHMLIDGGRSSAFTDHAAKSVSDCGELEVVCVSHIDEDHISGIVKMLEHEVDWRIHLHEKENPPSERTAKRKPSAPRPPKIKDIWHNGFGAQLEDLSGSVSSMLSQSASMQLAFTDPDEIPREHFLGDLAQGEASAIELTHRISANQLNIPLNDHFNGKLVRAQGGKATFLLGETKISIIGPFDEDLDDLRSEWLQWIDDNKAKVEKLQDEMDEDIERLGLSEADAFFDVMEKMKIATSEFGDRASVSTPNLASIMFLAEERGFSILMTGDGAGQDIVEGLRRRRKLDSNGRIHVDVLKVQHHGAGANIDEEFLKVVIANHYVFCGNGSHKNPELGVIDLIAKSRFPGEAQNGHDNASDPFTLHFNNDHTTANTEKRIKHMKALEKHVKKLASQSNGQMDFHFNAEDFFDLSF